MKPQHSGENGGSNDERDDVEADHGAVLRVVAVHRGLVTKGFCGF